METQPVKVIHLDDAVSWRGGQQQTVYLFEGMLNRNLNTVLLCQPDSEYQKYCDDRKLPYRTIRMRGEWDIIAGRKIAGICKTGGYNIIHAHSAHALMIGFWAKLFHRSVKLVAARRVDFSVRKNALSILKYNNSFVDKIICISERIRHVLIRDGIPESKLAVVHSGINTHKFDKSEVPASFRKRWEIPDDHIIVGTVAALTGHKDYPNLLRAAKLVTEKLPDVTFMAVGRLNLENRFIFTGFQKDIGAFLKSFDIFVLASKMEGLGTSVLDAMAAGLPVIGARAGGIPEMIQNDKNGLIVEPQNPEKLAEAVISLVRNKEERKRLSRNGKLSVTNFSIDATLDKTIALYENL